jgi:hypothetical protein
MTPDSRFTLFTGLLQSYNADNYLLLHNLSRFTPYVMFWESVNLSTRRNETAKNRGDPLKRRGFQRTLCA